MLCAHVHRNRRSPLIVFSSRQLLLIEMSVIVRRILSRALKKRMNKLMDALTKTRGAPPEETTTAKPLSKYHSPDISSPRCSRDEYERRYVCIEDTQTKPVVGSFGSVTRAVLYDKLQGEPLHVAIKRCFNPRDQVMEIVVAHWLTELMLPVLWSTMSRRVCFPLFVGLDNAIVYPFMQGGTLYSRLNYVGRFIRRYGVTTREKRVKVLWMLRTWVLDVARTLAYLHGLGAAHGDIKSNNIMFQTPEDVVPVLIDFGSCGAADEHMDDTMLMMEERRRMPYYANTSRPTRKQDDLYGVAAITMEVLCVWIMQDDEDLHDCMHDVAAFCCEEPVRWKTKIAHLCKACTASDDLDDMISMQAFANALERILDDADAETPSRT